MSSDILTCLQLNKNNQANNIIVVKEINGCDSSFLISCVIGHCIRQKSPLIIISIHNPLSHFQNVGLKMNYNLQKYLDTGLISFFALGSELANTLINNQTVTQDSVINNTKKVISDMQQKHGKVNVIIDGISHLFNLDYNIRDVNTFCNEIIRSVNECSGAFIICHCNIASDTDSSYIFSNLLSYKAYTVVEVSSLVSGLSADVSGHITIRYPGQKFEAEHINVLMPGSKQYLFKLFDRGVKLFAPGTI